MMALSSQQSTEYARFSAERKVVWDTHLDKLEQFTPDQLKAKANILSVSGATVNWATGCNYTDAEKEYIEAAMPISKWAIEVPLILAEAAVLAADGASVTLIKSILKGR
jgi:hypothetical protein